MEITNYTWEEQQLFADELAKYLKENGLDLEEIYNGYRRKLVDLKVRSYSIVDILNTTNSEEILNLENIALAEGFQNLEDLKRLIFNFDNNLLITIKNLNPKTDEEELNKKFYENFAVYYLQNREENDEELNNLEKTVNYLEKMF